MTDKCPLCLEEFTSNVGCSVPCGHCFCTECFHNLQKNNAKENDYEENPCLRCPVCKTPSETFIPLYINFAKHEGDSKSSCRSSCCDDATAAIAALSSEKLRLTRKLHNLKSITKDQTNAIDKLLPEYERMEEQIKRLSADKAELENDVRDLEMENNALISEWNEIEIKNNLLKTEKMELKSQLQKSMKENVDLCNTWSKMALRLGKVKRKRREIKTVYKRGVLKQRQQALELNVVKSQMVKSTAERKQLSLLLELSRAEVVKMKRGVKRLKKFYRNGSTSKAKRFSAYMSKIKPRM